MRSYAVFQFTQRAIENRSTCHAWHACRRLPTPGLGDYLVCVSSCLFPSLEFFQLSDQFS
jgi:hypothetical protein